MTEGPPGFLTAPEMDHFSLKPLMFETFVSSIAMMSFVALIGPLARILGLAPWQAGTAVTVGGMTWILCSPAWGMASDRRGRRRIMLQGFSGFVLAYFALCTFLVAILKTPPPLWLTFAGVVLLRGTVGGFYAAIPTTTAALVADHTEPAKRAGAMATIGAASAVGMVIGPGFVGFLASYSLSLPLYVTAVLPAIALFVLWRWLPRIEHHASHSASSLRIGDPRLRRPLTVAFIAMFSVTIAQVTVGFFALDRLHLNPPAAARAAGIALAVVGLALILAQTLVRLLEWPPARLIRIGGTIQAFDSGCCTCRYTMPAR